MMIYIYINDDCILICVILKILNKIIYQIILKSNFPII